MRSHRSKRKPSDGSSLAIVWLWPANGGRDLNVNRRNRASAQSQPREPIDDQQDTLRRLRCLAACSAWRMQRSAKRRRQSGRCKCQYTGLDWAHLRDRVQQHGRRKCPGHLPATEMGDRQRALISAAPSPIPRRMNGAAPPSGTRSVQRFSRPGWSASCTSHCPRWCSVGGEAMFTGIDLPALGFGCRRKRGDRVRHPYCARPIGGDHDHRDVSSPSGRPHS
jgi:hypothetical protein